MRPPASFRPVGATFTPTGSFVCRSCRLGRRPVSSATTAPPGPAIAASPPPPHSSGIARLSSRRLISVSGPDAAKYLQGVITASITDPAGEARRSGFYAAFLSAPGRVLHDVFVYPDTLGVASSGGSGDAKLGESFLIEVDADEAERLQKHIRRYKLRAKFAVRLLEQGEWSVWQAWDDGDPSIGGLASMADAEQQHGVILRDPRLPALGYRLLAARDGPPPQVDLAQAPESAYQIRRYLHGVPEGQDEVLREQALPLEANMDAAGAIDFRKGCYVGQELTIRTKHRGVVRKRVLPCVLYAPEQAMPAELAYHPGIELASEPRPAGAENLPSGLSIGRVGKKGRSAGKWLKGVGNVGLALCRLEIMTDVVLPGETASATYNPEDEFVIQERLDADQVGQAFKIKAFVPLWLRQGLNQTPHP